MRAVRFHEYGNFDVLRLDEVADPVPDAQARLSARAHYGKVVLTSA